MPSRLHTPGNDRAFYVALGALSATYIGLVVFMMLGMFVFLIFRADFAQSIVVRNIFEPADMYDHHDRVRVGRDSNWLPDVTSDISR